MLRWFAQYFNWRYSFFSWLHDIWRMFLSPWGLFLILFYFSRCSSDVIISKFLVSSYGGRSQGRVLSRAVGQKNRAVYPVCEYSRSRTCASPWGSNFLEQCLQQEVPVCMEWTLAGVEWEVLTRQSFSFLPASPNQVCPWSHLKDRNHSSPVDTLAAQFLLVKSFWLLLKSI